MVKCFSCGKAASDPIFFLSDLTGKSKSGVISDVINGEFGLRFSRALDSSEREREQTQRIKGLINKALKAVMVNAAVYYYKEEYRYCRPAIKLLAKRGIYLSPDNLQSLPLGIFPNKLHLKRFIKNGTCLILHCGIWPIREPFSSCRRAISTWFARVSCYMAFIRQMKRVEPFRLSLLWLGNRVLFTLR